MKTIEQEWQIRIDEEFFCKEWNEHEMRIARAAFFTGASAAIINLAGSLALPEEEAIKHHEALLNETQSVLDGLTKNKPA